MEMLQRRRAGTLLLAILGAVHAPGLSAQQPVQAADSVPARDSR